MATPYDLAPQTDPIWDAFLAQYGWQQQQAKANAGLKRTTEDQRYAKALDDLVQRGLTSNTNLSTNLLSRGVFASGEAQTRRDELANTLAKARTDADTTYAQNQARIAADERSALDSLDFSREREVAASRERLAEKQRQSDAAALATLTNAGTSPETFTSVASSGGRPPAPTWTPSATRETNTRASNESGLGYSTAGRGSMGLLDQITTPKATPPPKPTASNESGLGYSTAGLKPTTTARGGSARGYRS